MLWLDVAGDIRLIVGWFTMRCTAATEFGLQISAMWSMQAAKADTDVTDWCDIM